ncbi:MAG: RIP metalloprotease RseP [Micavibrio sp.]|nr:RIP metalloprotease RseP [Micavibrio sp.]
MEIFDLFQLIASNIWLYGVTFLLVLSILVFVHEWGHYIVARLCGVRVEVFSIGFGKELFGWNDKNDTRWKFSLIPLGGYVKMFGDTDMSSSGHVDGVNNGEKIRPFTEDEKQVAFYLKPVWKRALIVFAGPGINFLFAILLLTGMYSIYGQPVTPPQASAVIEGSAADKAGFKPHDKVISIDGEKISRFEDIRRIVTVALDTPLKFKVDRDGKEVVLTATPARETMTDRFGFESSRGMLGIVGPSSGLHIDSIVAVNGKKVTTADERRAALLKAMDRPATISLDRGEQTDKFDIMPIAANNEALKDSESAGYNSLVIALSSDEEFMQHGILDGFTSAAAETWAITRSTLTALGQMVTGTRSATELGGIIRIGAIAGDMAQAGMIAIVTFTALLSINLGLINLFPIPMLDGGHLVFYGLEAIKGKPVSEKVQEYAFRVGFALLIGLMIFANINDIIQIVL